jgi:hypothetical protein
MHSCRYPANHDLQTESTRVPPGLISFVLCAKLRTKQRYGRTPNCSYDGPLEALFVGGLDIRLVDARNASLFCASPSYVIGRI